MNQNRSQNSVSWAQNMAKMRWPPDPAGGAYSTPPDPLAAIRGLLLRGGEERGGAGGREGRRGGSRHTNPHLLPAPMHTADVLSTTQHIISLSL